MTGDKIDKERLRRIFQGESTNEDEQFLLGLFRDKTLTNELKCQMKRQLYEVCSQKSVPEKNLDHILYRLNYDINTGSGRVVKPIWRLFKRAAGIAAVFIFLVSVSSAIYYKTRSEGVDKTWTEIKAPAWTQASFTLPDSTKVCLNSRSSIKYRGDFLSERSVILDGEAYFDVRSDKQRPFTVEADDLYIKALGTRFNVASYNDEKNMEIVLEEGQLMINDRDLKRSIMVVPNELITYNKEKDEFLAEYIQTISYVSWKEGKLVFSGDPMAEVARRLERWYNVKITLADKEIEQYSFRATFVDDKLEDVLRFLAMTSPISYKINPRKLMTDGTYEKEEVIIYIR